jgi:hypothetical protein
MYWHCREQFHRGQAFRLAFFFGRGPTARYFMTQQHTRSRQQAEISFSKLQAPVIAKDLAEHERKAAVEARDEKTARLRVARLAKELADRTSATAALIAKRSATFSTTRSTD